VKDSDDLCKTMSGLPMYRGCPSDDADRDGFKNDRDQCPEQAETLNSVNDTDGCPD
jgi:hypothetical protein